MNILEAIVNARNGSAVTQLGSQVGLAPDQTAAALAALAPALAAGFQRNLQSPEGLARLTSALASGHHERYLDDPAALGNAAAVQDGNGILGHLLGGKDVSREVASRAAAQTGLSPDILKQLLPLAAAAMMGVFAKQTSAPGSLPGLAGGQGGGLMSMLTPLLDKDRDGSIMDDVTSMLGRFIKPT